MESRRMSTRSSRRAAPVPVSPVKQATMANVMQAAGKSLVKRSRRKVLADKTNANANATPVARSVPAKSSKKASARTSAAAVSAAWPKAEEEVVPACDDRQQQETPAVVRGEDFLRTLVHGTLAHVQTPEGVARQRSDAETPQFRVTSAISPLRNSVVESTKIGVEVDISSPPPQAEVVDAVPAAEILPFVEILVDSPADRKAIYMSERLSSAWVGCDVDDVPEFGEGDDSDCSVLVNVSSPGMHLVASPAPASTIHTNTPQSADFKWIRRDQLTPKVNGQEPCAFNYDGGDEEYEGCDENDEAQDCDGEVIDCDEICQAISRMGLAEGATAAAGGLPEHKGRHIRFNYNSDDEIDVEEVDVIRLRGMPTPKGKHLRFPDDQEVLPS